MCVRVCARVCVHVCMCVCVCVYVCVEVGSLILDPVESKKYASFFLGFKEGGAAVIPPYFVLVW